ncbi:hypothetical protein DYB32_004677 [Aphanomyces invadans]|uniref:Cyclin C-terminal domain-containing protein n=1 Tax=Aphanomyces invadans TaxID=157072 RepID=A0A3R6YZB7_9STRA|nr:hypothetical protein DYB32_004677 [Aphanomyces invadans]
MYSGMYPPTTEHRLVDTQMGHEMTKDTVELDFDVVRNYRLREIEKVYSVCSYVHSLTPMEWPSFNTFRARLVHRVVCVASSLALKRETCHLACSYLTRILLSNLLHHGYLVPTYVNSMKTPEHPSVVITSAAVVIACKIEEVSPPSIQEILEAVQRESGEIIELQTRKRGPSARSKSKKTKPHSIYTTKEEVVAEEEAMLKTLEWKLYPATSVSWLLLTMEGLGLYKDPIQSSPCYVGYDYEYFGVKQQHNSHARASERANVFHIACNLLDVALLHANCLHFLPSMMAAAALFLIAPGHNLYALAHFLHLKAEDVWDCVTWLQQYLPYAASPVPFSVYSTMQSKLKKIPSVDKYAVQVVSTAVAYASFGMYMLPAVDDQPQYEPETERDVVLPPLYQCCIVPDVHFHPSQPYNTGYFA